jgi:hypothetical protein
MKSTSAFGNEPTLGRAGGAAKPKSKFEIGLARINQELWLVLSLFVIRGLFGWLV